MHDVRDIVDIVTHDVQDSINLVTHNVQDSIHLITYDVQDSINIVAHDVKDSMAHWYNDRRITLCKMLPTLFTCKISINKELN